MENYFRKNIGHLSRMPCVVSKKLDGRYFSIHVYFQYIVPYEEKLFDIVIDNYYYATGFKIELFLRMRIFVVLDFFICSLKKFGIFSA